MGTVEGIQSKAARKKETDRRIQQLSSMPCWLRVQPMYIYCDSQLHIFLLGLDVDVIIIETLPRVQSELRLDKGLERKSAP